MTDIGATWAREELEGAPKTRECLAGGKKTIWEVRGDLEELCVTFERALRTIELMVGHNAWTDKQTMHVRLQEIGKEAAAVLKLHTIA